MLVDAGFAKVDARNGWMWRDKVICVFNIRAVGRYFSEVTGWPPGSLGVWLAVLYTFMPSEQPVAQDEDGRLVPAEHLGHMRSHLDCRLNQEPRLRGLMNPAERRRRDIFWVQPDGSNADEVADDVAGALREEGLPWFSRVSSIEAALGDIEASHDCYAKFDKAAFLARELGDRDRWQRYAALAEVEAMRIKRPLDRVARYGI